MRAPSQKITGVNRIQTSQPGAMAPAVRQSGVECPASRLAMYVSVTSAIAGNIQTAVTMRHGIRDSSELCMRDEEGEKRACSNGRGGNGTAKATFAWHGLPLGEWSIDAVSGTCRSRSASIAQSRR